MQCDHSHVLLGGDFTLRSLVILVISADKLFRKSGRIGGYIS